MYSNKNQFASNLELSEWLSFRKIYNDMFHYRLREHLKSASGTSIQHVGQHSPAPVSHIYVDMLNLYPVLLFISFVYNT
jgi:hypothetical protein